MVGDQLEARVVVLVNREEARCRAVAARMDKRMPRPQTLGILLSVWL